ncbi:hypothetical protein EUZ85_28590 [Hahella sp. KA22]|uniref:nitroreductase family protein n=1 Tax=Hahella sp. KA22 TaxID=1628392 RepID=UPI000FDF2938|nr:nitroreductase family protein [Hahella sp. KA22]AZZ94456.1 hypothetical protein ENC22_26005 [Hahella sp. KA22]QAY57829.1 hypothetical protein EUZ85_28590 [Hahella sp. KA22]
MPSDFTHELQETVDLARWAPSSHNSQPWTLIHIQERERANALLGDRLQEGEQCVVLALNSARKLKALESLEIEMLMSCGLFLGLFCMSLGVKGHDWRPRWLCEGEKDAPLTALEQEHGCLALTAVRITPDSIKPVSDAEEWRRLVLHRRTHRGPFNPLRISDDGLQKLLARRWPLSLTGEHLLMRIERDPATIRRAAQLVKQYAVLDFANYKAWRETYRYIHFSLDEDAEDGFYLQSLLGPQSKWSSLFYRCVLAPPVMQALRPFGAPQRMAEQLGALVEDSSQLLFCHLGEEHMTPKALTQAGARLMEVWLNAQEQKLAIHPASVMLQHDQARIEIERLRDENGRMIFFARLGAIKEVFDKSPRRKTNGIIATG